MWPPNIVGAYFLVACLMGVMLGMAVHSWIERIAAWFRAVFEVDTVSQLPADKEPEMKEFMGKVLDMMKDFKKQTV